MQRVRLQIAYDGTDFHGFARQRGFRTVQGTLEEILARIVGHPVEVVGSGRTDAGVHARAQVVHWDQERGPAPEKWPYVLKRLLPRDIIPIAASAAPDGFHARFSVRQKTYRYTIQRAPVEDVYTHRYSWHEPRTLDLQRMREAAQALEGTHDFTSFCAAATPIEDKVRTLYEVRLQERDSYLDIYCTGNGFLQYMVRIVAGTLVDVGEGRLRRTVSEILFERDRTMAGRTAPARGLTLWAIDYGEYDQQPPGEPLPKSLDHGCQV